MNAELIKQLDKITPKIAKAAPTKASMTFTIIKGILLSTVAPMLIQELVSSRLSAKAKTVLRKVRDVLNDAELGDSE